MALIPKKFKFKKYAKGQIKTINKNKTLVFGDFGIKALESGRLTPKQIEATRKVIKKLLKPHGGIVRIKIRAWLPVSSKPIAVRMGRGKGKIAFSISPVKKGTILFEIYCQKKDIALKAAQQGGFRLPIKTLIIKKK
jgi:large subunit ribosomal protein L16